MTIADFLESLKSLLAKFTQDEPETAELSTGETTIKLSAGVEAEVEVARSGRFVDMNKNAVEITPDLMKGLATSLDLSKHEPKLKLGHEPIKTDTPDFGSVVGLAYDEAKDRLMAKIRPTLALVRRIREGAFNERSMEFTNPADPSKARFVHLGFLGARKPAISGLAPVALADGAIADGVVVLATDAEVAEEKPGEGIDKAGKDGAEEKQMAEPAEKIERLRNQVIDGARDRAKAFLAANVKRIPNSLIKAKVEDGLVALMTQEADADSPATFNLAGPDGKDKATTASAFVFALLAALPEQITAAEAAEEATNGAEPEAVNMAEFPDADEESVRFHLSIEKERAEAKEKGAVLSYLEGAQRVEQKRRNVKK